MNSPVTAVELPPHLRRPNLRRAAAAEYLGRAWGLTFAPETLRKWASAGIGPRLRHVNRTPFYATADLDAWAVQKLGPTPAPTDRPQGDRIGGMDKVDAVDAAVLN